MIGWCRIGPVSSTAPVLELLRTGTSLGMRVLGLTRAPLALAAPLIRPRSAVGAAPAVVRHGGEDLPAAALDPDRVARAFPRATGRLLVLVPDGADDETSWSHGTEHTGATYADRLATLLSWTPVHLRVDPATDPGELAVEVSSLLQRLVQAWPVEVDRIAFLAHGSGGLAVRAACGVSHTEGQSWTGRVSDVIALGTPHLAVPSRRTTSALGRDLEERLAGITTVDRADPEVPALPAAAYAVVTPSARVEPNLLGGLLGNVLWWRQRVTLRPRRAHALFPTAQVHHVDTRDLPLANHPDVHTALLAWLA